MNCCHNHNRNLSRRDFLSKTAMGMGAAALGSLLNPIDLGAKSHLDILSGGGMLGGPHFAPKAKRIIFLLQSGAPSQLDLFDYKPLLNKMNGEQLPDSVRMGQRLTGMSAGQSSLALAGSQFSFQQYGESRAWVSELMPRTAQVVDELCFVKSMHTEAINHDPAITFIQTGSQLAGRPSIGSWLHYGLGSDNENLPSFIVLVSKNKGGQPLYARLWGSGFLPSKHQGVPFRAGSDPVLFLNNPAGLDQTDRRKMLDYLRRLHEMEQEVVGDPELNNKIAQYEMAYRMQTSVPETLDLSDEPDWVFDLYGPDSRDPGTFAANCLQARRLAERGVKFIQLYHQGWDQHLGLPKAIRVQARETDQASAGLITDLKQRGLLEDTLVIWGGEFGRTAYSQGKLTKDDYGRDHHPNCFTIWMAGAGVKAGYTLGQTDEFGYNIVSNPVHVHDFQATILHLLGIDHERLTFKHQGRYYRLTDVHGQVVKQILA
jgi:hypothetical protein